MFDALTTHNKRLEAQIPKQANSLSMSSSRMPSKPEPKHSKQCSVMIFMGANNLRDLRGLAMMSITR